jgi:formyl-CoA transferase
MMASAKLPLARYKILDFTAHRSGPTTVRHLADWGADVLKVEMPQTADDPMGGPRDGFDFQNLHRNKKSITLNLKSPKGREIFLQLAKTSDVVVENHRSDVKKRLGVDYEAVRAVNPGIVYGSISGFGQDGPYATRPGVDQIAQGMGGLMSVTGQPGQGPMRVGVPIADLASGMFLAMGILTALLHREATGEGQWITTSLLEAQIAMLDFQAARWLINREVPGQAGNEHPTGVPTGVFPSADGYLNIAATGTVWPRLARAIGAPELVEDPRFKTGALRLQNRAAVNAEIAARTMRKTSAEWDNILGEAGVPCGPINTIDKTFSDPQVQHLKIARPVQHPRLGKYDVVASPIQMSATPQPAELHPAPDSGQHTDSVLAGLGYSADQIATLRREGVI